MGQAWHSAREPDTGERGDAGLARAGLLRPRHSKTGVLAQEPDRADDSECCRSRGITVLEVTTRSSDSCLVWQSG